MPEGLEGAVKGAAGGIDAPLQLAEMFRVAGAGLAEGQIFTRAEGLLVGELPELGFGGAKAAQGPLAMDEFIDEEAGFGGSGVVVVVILFGEMVEVSQFLTGEDQGFGMDAGGEAVEGRGGFASGGFGAGGFLGIEAIGVDLALGRHARRFLLPG